jgi:hypothetical protein
LYVTRELEGVGVRRGLFSTMKLTLKSALGLFWMMMVNAVVVRSEATAG